jgi:hypothetical protein
VPPGQQSAGELPEGLMIGEHGGVEDPSSGLAEVLGKKVEEQPAQRGEQLGVTQEAAKDPWDCPDELAVGQTEKQTVAKVLPQ